MKPFGSLRFTVFGAGAVPDAAAPAPAPGPGPGPGPRAMKRLAKAEVKAAAIRLDSDRIASARKLKSVAAITDHVVAADGLAYCVIGGRLYVWEGVHGCWRGEESARNVLSLARGANLKLHILQGDPADPSVRLLRQIERDGTPSGEVPVALPPGTLEFAVAGGGGVAFTDAAHPGQLGFIPAGQPGAGRPEARWIALPPGALAVAVRSMAFKHDGQLALLDADGKIWTRRVAAAETEIWTGDNVLPAADDAAPAAAAPGSQPPGPRIALQKLYTRLDGDVGAVDDRDLPFERGLGGAWQPALHAGASSKVERAFDQLRSAPRGGVEAVGIAAPIPFGEQNWYKDQKSWKPSFLTRRYKGQKLWPRYHAWFLGHRPQFTARHGLFGEAKQALHASARADVATLLGGAGLRPVEGRDGELCGRINRNTAAILATLDKQIGVDAVGQLMPGIAGGRRYRRMRAATAVVWSEQNALFVLYSAQRRLFGMDDPHALHLARLLNLNIFLAHDSERHFVADVGAALRLHRVKNRFCILTWKMAHDLAVLAQAMREPPAGGAAAPERNWEALVDGPAENDPGLPLNPITQCFSSGWHDADGVDQFHDMVNHLSGALRRPQHKLRRAMLLEGGLLGENEHKRDPVEYFSEMIQELPIGHKLVLDLRDTLGLAAEGMTQFKTLVKWVTAVGTAQLASIEPVSEIAGKRGHQLAVTRTEDGFTLELARSGEYNIQPLGVKIGQGFGFVKVVNGMLLFQYTGINTKPMLNLMRRKNHVVSMDFRNDDAGDLGELVRRLYRGETGAYELMARAEQVSNTREASWTLEAKVDIEPLIATGIIASVDDGRFAKVLKLIVAPAVGQLNLLYSGTVGRARGRSSTGTEQETRTRETKLRVGATYIGVVEGQYGDSYGTAPAADFQSQSKLPIWIKLLMKELWGKPLSNNGYSMQFDAGGALRAVTMDVGADKLSGKLSAKARLRRELLNPNNHFTTKNIPQLGSLVRSNPELVPYLDALVKARSPLTVSLELKPEVVREIEQFRRGEHAGDAAPAAPPPPAISERWLELPADLVASRGKFLAADEVMRGAREGAEAGRAAEQAAVLAQAEDLAPQSNPEALRRAQAAAQQRRPSPAEVQEFIRSRLKAPGNFRIACINASMANKYKTSWSTGVLVFRYGSGADNTLLRKDASITVSYPDAEPAGTRPTLKVEGPLLHFPQTEAYIEAAQRILAADGISLMEFLAFPVGEDEDRRRLAPVMHDLMRQLRAFDLRELDPVLGMPRGLSPEQREALLAFFPDPEGGTQADPLRLATIVGDTNMFTMFQRGLEGRVAPPVPVVALSQLPVRSSSTMARLKQRASALLTDSIQAERMAALAPNPLDAARQMLDRLAALDGARDRVKRASFWSRLAMDGVSRRKAQFDYGQIHTPEAKRARAELDAAVKALPLARESLAATEKELARLQAPPAGVANAVLRQRLGARAVAVAAELVRCRDEVVAQERALQAALDLFDLDLAAVDAAADAPRAHSRAKAEALLAAAAAKAEAAAAQPGAAPAKGTGAG